MPSTMTGMSIGRGCMQLGGILESLSKRLAVTLLQKMVPAENVDERPVQPTGNQYRFLAEPSPSCTGEEICEMVFTRL
jgi:hypothetical protein